MIWLVSRVGEQLQIFDQMNLHMNLFLPSVDIICVFRKTFWPNDFLQLEHVLALTPLWVSVRVYRIQSWANNIWQLSQVYAVLYCCGLQFASPDFLLDRMTSHILNKSSSMLLSIQAISSLREDIKRKKMFSFGHCPNEGGGVYPCPKENVFFTDVFP